MKKIALDLDGVVFDSENLYRVYSEIYDVDVLKGNNIIDNSKRTFQQRYSWSVDTSSDFYSSYSKEILTAANIMPGADIVLKKLSEEFEFVIVTARSDIEIDYAKDKFKLLGLDKVQIFSNEKDKINCLINNNIDYIIDDCEDICKNAALNNITALHFRNAAGYLTPENEYLKVVNNWGEIYKYFFEFR